MTHDDSIPAYKVGAVILRQRKGSGHTSGGDLETGDVIETLVVRPRPTHNDGKLPNLALPRGSRQYESRDGDAVVWKDSRDDDTARRVVNRMEPLHETLLREIEQEAGIPEEVLLQQKEVYELGEPRPYTSPRTGETYPVFWYVIWLDEKGEKILQENHDAQKLPKDSSAVEWRPPHELDDLAHPAQNLFSPDYAVLVNDAIHDSMYKDLKKVDLRELDLGTHRGR